jgi:hypothetical protein
MDTLEAVGNQTHNFRDIDLRWRLSEAFDNLKTRNLVEPSPVQPELRRQLIEVYREDILKLQD